MPRREEIIVPNTLNPKILVGLTFYSRTSTCVFHVLFGTRVSRVTFDGGKTTEKINMSDGNHTVSRVDISTSTIICSWAAILVHHILQSS